MPARRKTRDGKLNRLPGESNGDTARSLELAKEFDYAGVISPPFFGSAIAASRIASSESLSFHGHVCFRIDICRVKRNVAQPCPDCVEVNASARQVGCVCMA